MPVKTSISKGKAATIAIKFSVSYIRVGSAKQADESKSGIRKQEKQYQKWLKENIPNIEILINLNLWMQE